jgi:signal transduction histidine kinase/CheY-like chemotaxis protein
VTLRRSLLWVVVASLVPVLILGAVLIKELDRRQRQGTREHVLRTIRVLSDAVDRELHVALATLNGLADSPLINDTQYPAFHAQLVAVAVRSGWIDAAVLDAQGQIRLHSLRPPGAPLPSLADHDYVQAALQTGRPTISNLLLDARVMDEPAVIVALPVVRDRLPKYVLTATLSPRRLREVLRAQPVPEGWRFALNDARQIVIASTEDPDPFMGQPVTARMAQESATASEGWFPNVSKDGRAIYAAFYKSPVTGWATVANVPRAAIDGPSNRTLAVMVLGALVVMGASAGVAVWLGRRLARDVAQVRDAAVALRHGRAPDIPPTPVTELRAVGTALRETALLLSAQAHERSELLVRERNAHAEAVRLNSAKDEFLAMLGHELRNPLGAIAGAVVILERRGTSDDAAGATRAIIARQVRYLTALVDDLLDVARVTSGKIRLSRQPVNLGALVERTVQTFTAAGHAAGHQPIVTVTPVWVDADATRLDQVVTNLVENAVKFTPVGGTIAVSVRREGPSAVLEVRDTGRGIAPSLLPYVFELFTQGNVAPDRAPSGLGLGLTLVDRLVALHGGTVTADSPGLGQGATFTVRLPAMEEPTRMTDTVAPLPAGRPRRILVIEDHADAREGLRMLLTLDGHDVTGVPDGVQGIEYALTNRPEVVIIDLGLPQVDGLQVARRLRANADTYYPRLVALTGYGQPEDRRRAVEAGFDAYLVKPATPDALRAAIATEG